MNLNRHVFGIQIKLELPLSTEFGSMQVFHLDDSNVVVTSVNHEFHPVMLLAETRSK
jgi:hypothetical protein